MMRSSLRPYTTMGIVVATLLLITAGAGLLVRDIYTPFLSEEIVAFQYFQDMLSLLFAPLLLVAIYFVTQRASTRAFVIWNGILIFAAYYYAFYCFGFVYTFVYPLYLAVMGLATFSFTGMLTGVDLDSFQQHVGGRMPVRLISGVLGMTVLFTPLWLAMLWQGIKTQQVSTTDLVFVLDLPFLIPACALAAIQLWRHRPIGYLLSGPLLFKAAISGLLLTGGELLKMQRGLAPALDQLALYLILAIVGTVALVQYLRNLQDEPRPDREPTNVPPFSPQAN